MATSAVEVDDAELVTGMSCLRASHSLSWTRPRLLLSNAIAHSRWIDFALGCSCITVHTRRRAARDARLEHGLEASNFLQVSNTCVGACQCSLLITHATTMV